MMEEEAARKAEMGRGISNFAPIGGLKNFFPLGKLTKFMKSSKFEIVREPVTRNIYLNPKGIDLPYQNTIIFLHGLGDSAETLMELFHENGCNSNWIPPDTRIVLPTAPMAKVTANRGKKLTSWFDVYNKKTKGLKSIRQRYN
jgi:hypothetical protein